MRMNTKSVNWKVALLMAMLTLPGTSSAQQKVRYKLIDIGTFGGPASYLGDPGSGDSVMLNDAGVLVGRAATATPDPFCLDPDCFVAASFRWENGILTSLRGSAGGIGASGINPGGSIALNGNNGQIDPLLGGPELRGFVWRDGLLTDLGTLGAGVETAALYVNNAGQVVGMATISTDPDPSGFSFVVAPLHTFIWQNGVMKDIGTLGGPDALANSNCNNLRANLVTGLSILADLVTVHPYLWDNGKITDLGTLGGNFFGEAQCANNAGQVAGTSTLVGDATFHAFLWQNNVMRDLGTLGGDNSSAAWINVAGDVVGDADLPGADVTGLHHAFLWHHGMMTDLGTLGSTSHAIAMNANGQVVGQSRLGDPSSSLQHAFLSEKGGPMADLNNLISPNSPLELYTAEDVNDPGWIAGRGLPGGCDDIDACGHVFLLIPCDPAKGQDCSAVNAGTNGTVPNKRPGMSLRQARRTSTAGSLRQQANRMHVLPLRD